MSIVQLIRSYSTLFIPKTIQRRVYGSSSFMRQAFSFSAPFHCSIPKSLNNRSITLSVKRVYNPFIWLAFCCAVGFFPSYVQATSDASAYVDLSQASQTQTWSTHLKQRVAAIYQERAYCWDLIVQLVELEDKGDRNPEVAALLISDASDSIWVSQEFARKLLSIDSFGQLRRVDDKHYGHHPTLRAGGGYFKSDTLLPHLDPTMETATYLFHSLLFGKGVAPSRFMFIKNIEINEISAASPPHLALIEAVIEGKEEALLSTTPSFPIEYAQRKETYLMQFSKEAIGISGREFLEKVEAKEASLHELEIKDFQKHLITTMLLYSGDAKSENFMVVGDGKNKQLIFFDNDAQFFMHLKAVDESEDVSSLIQEFGGCKNILFLLSPLMDQKIAPELVNYLLSVDEEALLELWLVEIEKMNTHLDTLMESHCLSKARCEKNFIPFSLHRDYVDMIVENIRTLKQHLVIFPELTSTDLFKLMRKDLYQYYTCMQAKYDTYLKTHKKLYSNERPLTLGRKEGERIKIKALRGRWLFNALERIRKEREFPFDKKPYSETWADALLKNIDDALFEDLIAKEFTKQLLQNNLPDLIKERYPYNLIASLSMAYDKDLAPLKRLIDVFARKQETYEEFVLASYEQKKRDPSYQLGEGVIECLQLLNKT